MVSGTGPSTTIHLANRGIGQKFGGRSAEKRLQESPRSGSGADKDPGVVVQIATHRPRCLGSAGVYQAEFMLCSAVGSTVSCCACDEVVSGGRHLTFVA